MLLRGGRRNRIGAAVALVAVLVMVLAAPAEASGWGWGEEKIWSGGFFQQVLTWLSLTPSTGVNTKGPGGAIDPNGAPVLHKSLNKDGASIDPNGASTTSLANCRTIDDGASIDPNGLH